ncbi:hypothetical protein AXF42_Ash006673 [Apostasia shenzhenica]|uniref:Uncharacterized protein n=1 Tax=Apostasia shenzhenica TaxID=1088818 RepID=A0A2I0AIV8_9ASPA|nr:hypothetical protein AXF42_Ash006673 [Apostasia shenzhenica]
MAHASIHITLGLAGRQIASGFAPEHLECTHGGLHGMGTKRIWRRTQGERLSQDERPSTNNP